MTAAKRIAEAVVVAVLVKVGEKALDRFEKWWDERKETDS